MIRAALEIQHGNIPVQRFAPEKSLGRGISPARKRKEPSDMQSVQEVAIGNQAVPPDLKRKVGVEIVRSADLTQRFYKHPDRFAEFSGEDCAWLRRVAIAKRAA